MTNELQKKVDFGIMLIQRASEMASKMGQPLEIAYSGGKDSDVILELARMANVPYRAIYKNTTIDPSGTIKHARDNGAEIINPNETFLQLIKSKGLPSRWYRFCCSTLKEYKILDYIVIGVRRAESTKRAKLYTEPERCRVFSKNVKERQYLPLLEWSNQDVADFIAERGIKCHPLYYDEEGNFHVERRLGCLCCPLQSKDKRVAEFKRYPNMVKLYLRGMREYWDTHENVKTRKYYNNIYEWFCSNVFCENRIMAFKEKFGANLFEGAVDCKEYLENYFNIELDF